MHNHKVTSLIDTDLRHALVPLRQNANEHSFFGSTGLTTTEQQEGLVYVGKPKASDTELMFPLDFGDSSYYDVNDKENIFFELGDSACPMMVSTKALRDSDPTLIDSSVLVDHTVQMAEAINGLNDMPEAGVQLPATQTSEYSDCSSTSLCDTEEYEYSSPSLKRSRTARQKQRNYSFKNYEMGGNNKIVEASVPESNALEARIVEKQPRFEGDIYTPKYQRGVGETKEGFCSLCNPGVWLRIKQSSYWYHMNYHHGISAATGRPYEQPEHIELEAIESGENVLVRISGLCGCCEKFICIASVYLTDEQKESTAQLDELINVNNLNFQPWYRHCQRCHKL